MQKIRNQWRNYSTLFRWLMGTYYQQEKWAFWFVQALMGAATVLGFIWMTGVVLGFAHEQGAVPERYRLFAPLFQQPLWVWLGLLSVAGLLSAVAFYLSFRVGVESALRFQGRLFQDVLQAYWRTFTLQPRNDQVSRELLRILRLNTHLAGQVCRRLTRAFIPALTAIVGSFGLFYLNFDLTLMLLPLFILYAAALYRVNILAAETSNKLQQVFQHSQESLKAALRNRHPENGTAAVNESAKKILLESEYLPLSRLKYQRRLVEIHVTWIKTVLLVMAIILLVFGFGWNQHKGGVDWAALLIYLVLLRFTATGWQLLGMSTVAFSRFLPEIKELNAFLQHPENLSARASESLEDLEEY